MLTLDATSLWDMRDVLGVMVRLHPGAQRKRCKRGASLLF